MMDKMIPPNEAASLITHIAAWKHVHVYNVIYAHCRLTGECVLLK